MAVQISGNDITVPRDGTFSRNVSIAGTLTYEDVTNVDSIGLVTARNGIEVGASPGVAASISVDGNAIFSGITTIGGNVKVGTGVTLSPDGDVFTTGVSTFSDHVRVVTGDLRVGDDTDSNAGTKTISVGSVSSGSGGIGIFANPTNGNSFVQFGDGTASADQYRGWMNYQHASDNLNFGTAGTERARIESAGNVKIEKNLNVVGVCTANHFSSNSGTTIQRQFKYLISTTQLEKGGSISELNGALQISFTPKFADSNLIMEFDTSYVSPNTTNLYYCLFYDVTNSAGVSLPGASGSRVRCHWTKRSSPNDNNDNDHISMKIVTPANNTTARTYTIHFGSEGAQAQFFVSDLSSSGGSTYPMNFIITEIAA